MRALPVGLDPAAVQRLAATALVQSLQQLLLVRQVVGVLLESPQVREATPGRLRAGRMPGCWWQVGRDGVIGTGALVMLACVVVESHGS
jgi:hypothetical protein